MFQLYSKSPLFNLLPREAIVVCGPNAMTLNYSQQSRGGPCTVRSEVPYEITPEDLRGQLNLFRFRVARARFKASR